MARFQQQLFKAAGHIPTESTKQKTEYYTKGKGVEILTSCLIHDMDIDAILRTEN